MGKPNFYFENQLWKKGFKVVAGCDEVGRGAFAGPVVASAVAFAPMKNDKCRMTNGIRIDDSKKLTALQREKADKWIRKSCLAFGIGKASVGEINKWGISRATTSAFRRALINLQKRGSSRVEFLLIDAFFVPYLRGLPVGRIAKEQRNRRTKEIKNRKPKNKMIVKYGFRQSAIVNGDERSFSIAASSIIAKVYRDKLVIRLSKKSMYKRYGWERNKGYGTSEHRRVVAEHGVTSQHRKQFVQKYLRALK